MTQISANHLVEFLAHTEITDRQVAYLLKKLGDRLNLLIYARKMNGIAEI